MDKDAFIRVTLQFVMLMVEKCIDKTFTLDFIKQNLSHLIFAIGNEEVEFKWI